MPPVTRYILLPAAVGAVVGLTLILAMRADTGADNAAGYSHAVALASPAVVNIYTSRPVT